MTDAATATRQCCSFQLDHFLFGVPVLDVQEIMRQQKLAPVPQAADAVAGLLNLRGQIVVAIDLRRRLGLPPRAAGAKQVMLVVRTDEQPVSLVVDEIGDVLELSDDKREPPPETVAAGARELIESVYKLDQRLLLLLDTKKAIAV
jgi:purine-binding chemotaxis protein CheW